MLISVIVATFNAEKTLERCIRSVSSQTYPDRELVVMDGGSRDSTPSILERHSSEIAYWESKPDKGIYNAFNKALGRAKGEWICFLGADDYLWAPDVLARMAPHLEKARPEFRIVYGKVAVVTEAGEILEQVGKPWTHYRNKIQHELGIPHQGVFHHRSLFETHGYFDESFKITGDYDLLLRELKDRPALFVEGPVVTGMQFGGISSTLSQTLVNIRELRRARERNGFKGLSLPLLWRETRALTRRRLNTLLGEKATHYIADAYRIATGKPRLWTRPR